MSGDPRSLRCEHLCDPHSLITVTFWLLDNVSSTGGEYHSHLLVSVSHHVTISFSVDDTLLSRWVNLSTSFREAPSSVLIYIYIYIYIYIRFYIFNAMEVCLRPQVSWSFTNNNHQADNERKTRNRKNRKIQSKTVGIVYKSLCVLVSVCVCVRVL